MKQNWLMISLTPKSTNAPVSNMLITLDSNFFVKCMLDLLRFTVNNFEFENQN